MLVANNFFIWFILQVARLVHYLLTAYTWIIIGRAVISWVSADPYNPIVRFIYEATEPVLSRIRGILPISVGGIDFSPMIAIVFIFFLQNLLEYTVGHLAM